MVDTTASDDLTSPCISLAEGKVSQGMRKALQGLIDILHCPLCHEIFQKPTSLASCGHSFCEACIDNYSRRSSTCPVKGCGMPMSVVGGGRGSFRRINPQLAQCIESLQLVCQGLNRAPDNWWKNNNLIIAEDHLLTHPGASHDVHRTDSNDTMGNESDSDMENLIDLQSVKRHEGNYEIEDDWHQ